MRRLANQRTPRCCVKKATVTSGSKIDMSGVNFRARGEGKDGSAFQKRSASQSGRVLKRPAATGSWMSAICPSQAFGQSAAGIARRPVGSGPGAFGRADRFQTFLIDR